MKNLLLTFCMFLFFLPGKSQISDFTIDKCYFESTIGITHYTFANDSVIAGCGNEFGFEVGDNEILTMGTRLINMGQHDCSFFGLGEFDPCHGHIHLHDMANLYIANSCGEIIATGDKLGFNMQDGGNFMSWLLSGNNSCDDTWLNTFGTPDYSLSVHPSNDNFNGSDRMGLSAGYYDTYGPGTWGNGIRINSLANGIYYACFGGHFSQYMNQGLNIFPDTLSVSFQVSGTFPNRSVVIGVPVSNATPQSVGTVSASNTSNTSDVAVSWTDANSPCRYKITPVIIKGQTAQVLTNLSQYTTAKSFLFPYTLLHNANLLSGINGAAKYKFEVRAVNGANQSSAVRSSQTVNVK